MKYNYQNLSSCHTETQFTFRKVSLLLWSANLLSSSLTKALSTLTNITLIRCDQGDQGLLHLDKNDNFQIGPR